MKISQQIQRLNETLESDVELEAATDRPEIVQLNQPDNIPKDVWDMIQDNGRVATQRLNELLNSPRFHRLRAGEQAKLIQLAQDRAYGRPEQGQKRITKTVSHELSDETARALRNAQTRMNLP